MILYLTSQLKIYDTLAEIYSACQGRSLRKRFPTFINVFLFSWK